MSEDKNAKRNNTWSRNTHCSFERSARAYHFLRPILAHVCYDPNIEAAPSPSLTVTLVMSLRSRDPCRASDCAGYALFERPDLGAPFVVVQRKAYYRQTQLLKQGDVIISRANLEQR